MKEKREVTVQDDRGRDAYKLTMEDGMVRIAFARASLGCPAVHASNLKVALEVLMGERSQAT